MSVMPKSLLSLFGLLACLGLSGGEGPAFLEDKAKLIEHIKIRATPLEWKTALAGEERVHYLGERHDASEGRRELVRSMKAIKEAGITHLAMEMLAETYAAAVKKYCCDGSCDTDVFESFQKFGWDEQGYMAIAEAAKDAGITLVPIDLSYTERKVAQEKRQPLKYGSPEDFDEYCRLGADMINKRDEKMAANLARTLKKALKENPKARILVYAGAQHVIKSTQPKILQEKYGIASRSIHATSGEYPVLKALIESGKRDTALYIPVPAKEMDFDAYINFKIEWGESSPLVPQKKVGSH